MDLQALEKHELIQKINILNRKVEELERSNKNNKAWLALLAHDFKGVFANLIWILNLYKNKKVSFEILAEMFPDLEVNSQKNLKALDDTFLAARIQFESTIIQEEPINLKEVYIEIKESLFDAISKKELTLSFSGNEEASIIGSKLIVKSILTKIIDNAIKFSFRGGEIKFSVEKNTNNTTQIIVEDFGIGIDDYTLNKLFSLDAVATRGTEEEIGAGLGLVLVKEALILINGTIDISSNKDKGTKVQITL